MPIKKPTTHEILGEDLPNAYSVVKGLKIMIGDHDSDQYFEVEYCTYPSESAYKNGLKPIHLGTKSLKLDWGIFEEDAILDGQNIHDIIENLNVIEFSEFLLTATGDLAGGDIVD
jgi:hypothetical protein